MKTIVILVVLFGAACTLGAQGTLHVEFVEGDVSIEAERVDLGSLLRELDAVAGTQSTVPPDIASRRVSLRIFELPLAQAVRKVFNGLSLDYAVVGRRTIVVLAQSRTVTPTPIVRTDPAVVSGERALGAFELPGFQNQPRPGAATGLRPLPGTTPGGTRANQTLPGLGTELPFGSVPNPATGLPVDQPSPGLIGNRTPSILDLNQPQTQGSPTAPALPPATPNP